MTDGLQSYNVAVADENNDLNCTHLACWAHSRRGFVDLLKANPKSKCKSVITYIAKLYKIETTLRELLKKGLIAKDEFNLLRIEQTNPVFKEIGKWLDATKIRALEGGQLEKATNY